MTTCLYRDNFVGPVPEQPQTFILVRRISVHLKELGSRALSRVSKHVSDSVSQLNIYREDPNRVIKLQFASVAKVRFQLHELFLNSPILLGRHKASDTSVANCSTFLLH